MLQSSTQALLTRYPWIVANLAAPVFTFLRDPVEQAVSLYYHERLAGRAVGPLTDFLRTTHTFAAARALEITRQDEVLPALQSFAFVGITDELQASADQFADRLGKPRQDVPFERVSARDEQMAALSGAERRRIESLYPLEAELYARARESVMGGEQIGWKPDCQFDFLRLRPAIRSEVFTERPASGVAALQSVRAHDQGGMTRARFDCRETIGITIAFEVRDAAPLVEPAIRVNRFGHTVFVIAYVPEGGMPKAFLPGRHEVTTWMPGNLLNTGPFEVFVSLAQPSPVLRIDQLGDPLLLDITEPEMSETTARGSWRTPFPGGIRPLMKWTSSDRALAHHRNRIT